MSVPVTARADAPDAAALNALALLRASFDAAVAAADPLQIVAQHLPPKPKGKICVVGAGKAAASMAAALEAAWPVEIPLSGLVITRYAHGLPTRHIEVVDAGHPVPDESGARAAGEILRLAQTLSADDLLLVLMSGGASSLLSVPVPSIALADLKAVTRALLSSGAPIGEMNIVRKHLSQIAGGRLAAATQAQVLALIVSDVTGDQPADIGSGPCAPDPSTYADALQVLQRYGIEAPASVGHHLAAGARGEIDETPKPDAAIFSRVENRVIATAHRSLQAAAQYFEARGIHSLMLGDTVTGEAREVAKVYAALVREIRYHGDTTARPVALISGGECTVTLPAGAQGRGGRCSEFLLALAVELNGLPDVYALAADTDGIDGSEDNAGATLDPASIERAAGQGMIAGQCLASHDAWGFFHASGGLLVTGPTRTNVNDYRVILVG